MPKTRRSYSLPEEITSSILLWLPVRSLLRFRSVCKLWKSFISNDQFIKTHVNNSEKKRPSLLSLPYDLFGDVDSVICMNTRENPVGLYLPPPQLDFMIDHIRSCNGLVCVANDDACVIYLCNPSTQRFKLLPTPNIQSIHSGKVDIGFCFDSISNDYKILRIVYSYILEALEAEVYSENSQTWKEIQVPETVQSFIPCPHSQCVYFKTGVLYLDGSSELLSFSSRDEVFKVYQFPKSKWPIKKSNVLDFEGSVAMISCTDSNVSVHSLWTLDDVCGKVSWIEKFNIETGLLMDQAVLYLGFGQFVFVNHSSGSIYYEYDYRKKEAKKFPSIAPLGEVASVVKYSESLVSLRGFKQQE